MSAKNVGAVAALAGVSVRTLHHYDHVGLVVPTSARCSTKRADVLEHLSRQHRLLLEQADRPQHTIKAVEELSAHRSGIPLTRPCPLPSPTSTRSCSPARSLTSSGDHRAPPHR